MDRTINEALLGQILLKNKKLSSAQLDHALKIQGTDKKRRVLGETLIKLGYIHESDILDAMKEQIKIYRNTNARAD